MSALNLMKRFKNSSHVNNLLIQSSFLEADTDLHCWEALVMILSDPVCEDILLDIGMPVTHRNVRYNCRVISYNKRILLIRPKLSLANDGNYVRMFN